MSTPGLPLLTRWSCANTCITAYDGFCERFTYTDIWPATAQCLLGSCSDADRIALQRSVDKYCAAVGYPDVWGPYMWDATDGETTSTDTPTTTSSSTRSIATPSALSTPSATPPAGTPTLSTILPDNAVATPTGASILASTTLPSTNPSAEGQGSKSSGLSTGAVAGIAVGVVLLVSLILIAWFFLRWWKRKNEPNFPEGPDHSPTQSPKAKDFENAPVISYTIEDGMLTRKEKPNLSIVIR